MATFRTAVVIGATMTTGLTAGLFAAFSYAVMPGLTRADDRTFVAAMQRINEAILNARFGICFGGALVLTGLAVALHLSGGRRSVLPWIVAALLLNLVMFVVTVAINVPLNNALLAAGPIDRIPDPAAVRERFETSWVRWNVVRALASTAALGCLTWALVLTGRLSG